MDVLSESDPLVAVSEKNPETNQYEYFALTETIYDQPNPVFKTPIVMHYRFEQRQALMFEVFDMDCLVSEIAKVSPVRGKQRYLAWALAQQDYIGRAYTTLGDIVAAPNMSLTLPLQTHEGDRVFLATLTVRVSKITESKGEMVLFEMSAINIEKTDLVSADPYLEVSAMQTANTWTSIHKTEAVPDSRHPRWQPIFLNVVDLCHHDYDMPLKFTVHNWDQLSAKSECIGEFTSTLTDLLKLPRGAKQEIKSFKDQKPRGLLVFTAVEIREPEDQPILNYVRGGLQLHLMVAIDFTGSNGDVHDPSSLHFHGFNANEYQRAILAIGNVVTAYSAHGQVAAWGFGALVDGRTSHCFDLSLRKGGTMISGGVNGLLDTYKLALTRVILSGPTHFADILKAAEKQVQKPHESTKETKENTSNRSSAAPTCCSYGVLLIITDGVLDDVKETTDLLVRLSSYPISVIIIGVGGADFRGLQNLCSATLKSSTGALIKRRIVTAVAMRDYKSKPSLVGEACLTEVSKQIVEYCGINHIHGLTSNSRRKSV